MSINRYAFASDNASGLSPRALQALNEANESGVGSYGEDPWTGEACRLIREIFETDCEVFFVFNGTAANALALAAMCHSYHAVVCHEKAHIMTDECGAPEFITGGCKLLPCQGDLAKLTPEAVRQCLEFRRDVHFPKAHVLSLTQATEFGTVYQADEIHALTETAHAAGLRVHLDGARFANALATLDCHPGDLTWRAGIDVMSFGLTKLGAGIGEAVVFFDRELAKEFDYRSKQAGHLCSKMRLMTAPWCGLLREGHWLDLAREVNAKAQSLRQRLSALSGAEILFPTEANAVFALFPQAVNDAMLAKDWHYYELAGVGDSRLMCSWVTAAQDIDAFVRDLEEAFSSST